MPEKTISELSAIKSVYSRNTADNYFFMNRSEIMFEEEVLANIQNTLRGFSWTAAHFPHAVYSICF